VARDPNGEWWELADEETGVPYYYNSTTGATEWDPPESATIVPFHALLTSSVGQRLSIVVSNRGSMAFSADHPDPLTRKASRASLRSTTDGRLSRKNSLAASASASAARQRSKTDSIVVGSAEPVALMSSSFEYEQSAPAVVAALLAGVSPADSAQSLSDCDRVRDSSIVDAQLRLESGARPAATAASAAAMAARAESNESRRRSAQRHSQSETALETLKEALVTSGAVAAHDEGEEHVGTGTPTAATAAAACFSGPYTDSIYLGHHVDYKVPASATVGHFRSSEQSPRFDNSNGRPRNHSEQPRYGTVGPTRMSTMEYYPHDSASSVMMHSNRNRSMPSIGVDSRLYGMRTFASTQFAAQKRGFLRRKVPLEEMVSYTSETITRPLMNLPRELTRDAVRSFRIIQRYMGNTESGVPFKEKFAEVL
ncbi:hypothetical protein H4R26_005750, partial [Coemansia thaxteri]